MCNRVSVGAASVVVVANDVWQIASFYGHAAVEAGPVIPTPTRDKGGEI